MKLRLRVTPVYTLTGVKYLYTLVTQANEGCLVYRRNIPIYYFNAADGMYSDITAELKIPLNEYLQTNLPGFANQHSLKQKIWGVRSAKQSYRWFYLDKLPVTFFQQAVSA